MYRGEVEIVECPPSSKQCLIVSQWIFQSFTSKILASCLLKGLFEKAKIVIFI